MAIQTFGDTLMHYTGGTGCIYNTYELSPGLVRELIFGADEGQQLDNLTLTNWAEKNRELDLMDRINAQNARELTYKSATCCFGPYEWSYKD